MTSDEQLARWVDGESIHNMTTGECCPDFSCCNPALLVPRETRIAFRDASEAERSSMLWVFLGAAIGTLTEKKVYIAGGPTDES